MIQQNRTDFIINPFTRTVSHKAGNIIQLTAKEFDLLYFLISHKGKVFAKEQSMDSCRTDRKRKEENSLEIARNILLICIDDRKREMFEKLEVTVGTGQLLGEEKISLLLSRTPLLPLYGTKKKKLLKSGSKKHFPFPIWSEKRKSC